MTTYTKTELTKFYDITDKYWDVDDTSGLQKITLVGSTKVIQDKQLIASPGNEMGRGLVIVPKINADEGYSDTGFFPLLEKTNHWWFIWRDEAGNCGEVKLKCVSAATNNVMKDYFCAYFPPAMTKAAPALVTCAFRCEVYRLVAGQTDSYSLDRTIVTDSFEVYAEAPILGDDIVDNDTGFSRFATAAEKLETLNAQITQAEAQRVAEWNNIKAGGNIPDNAVTTAKIKDGAVTAAKLASDVTLGVADGSITTAKLANGSVSFTKIADGAVSYNHMDNQSIGIRAIEAELSSALVRSTEGDIIYSSGNIESAATGLKVKNIKPFHYSRYELIIGYSCNASDACISSANKENVSRITVSGNIANLNGASFVQSPFSMRCMALNFFEFLVTGNLSVGRSSSTSALSSVQDLEFWVESIPVMLQFASSSVVVSKTHSADSFRILSLRLYPRLHMFLNAGLEAVPEPTTYTVVKYINSRPQA